MKKNKLLEKIKQMSHEDLIANHFLTQSRFENQEKIRQEIRQEAIDMKIDLELQESISESLWRLLDDIDTASDMFKPSDTNGIISYKNFYEYVMKKQTERWKFLTTDANNHNKLVISAQFLLKRS